MSEPPAKKAKTEDPADGDGAAMEVDEVDAPNDSRPKVREQADFAVQDSTVNLLRGPNMLTPLTEGGLQYLLAGARSNIGIKAGRYMFEVQVVQNLAVPDGSSPSNPSAKPKHQLRIGLATQQASLFLGDSDESVFFDSDGTFGHHLARTAGSEKFGSGDCVAVVLNLLQDEPTLTLYKNGVRASKPQLLPEALRGKALYPAVCFRNMSLRYSFGPEPSMDMPFKCRMVQDAAKADVTATPAPKPKDGRHEVLFPVFLPGQGAFDWLDMFLNEHADYTELSDRMMMQWAEKSGVQRLKGYDLSTWGSQDRPDFSTGLKAFDCCDFKQSLLTVATMQPRNFVVMEMSNNLRLQGREAAMRLWPKDKFRRVCIVNIGEPTGVFKRESQELLLAEKQAKLDKEYEKNLPMYEQQRMLEKKKLEIQKATAAKTDKEAQAEEKVEVEEPQLPERPVAELTEEEKKMWCRPRPVADVSETELGKHFLEYSLPQRTEGFDDIRFEWTKAPKMCEESIKQFVEAKRLTARVDYVNPNEWFTTTYKAFQKEVEGWKTKAKVYTAQAGQKTAERQSRIKQRELKRGVVEKDKAARQRQAELRVERAAKNNASREERLKKATEMQEKMREYRQQHPTMQDKAEHMDLVEKVKSDIEKELKNEAELEIKAKDKEESEERAAQQMEIDFAKEIEQEKVEIEEETVKAEAFDKLDIFGVDDINDIGDGRPLYGSFAAEDWLLLQLRFELYLLLNAFHKDVQEEDRKFMHIDNLVFYYYKYYKKALTAKPFGFEMGDVQKLLRFVRDTVRIDPSLKLLKATVPLMETFDVFVMLTEEARRDRERRTTLGDTEAHIKVTAAAMPGLSGPIIGATGAGGPGSMSLDSLGAALGMQTAAKAKGKGQGKMGNNMGKMGPMSGMGAMGGKMGALGKMGMGMGMGKMGMGNPMMASAMGMMANMAAAQMMSKTLPPGLLQQPR
eukprot:TRINITY_DN536_c0_g1_i1.p1 TRINITY_DN536_c0_g1~~TRINITY_DN536_c0_g1_i1.p1  ORF type:complete len:962 (+),score=326.75 TRINITY_DN536_c0_g1_i1:103-2988(+)